MVMDGPGTHNGTVLTDGTSVLDLDNSSIAGGLVSNAGTIYSTGVSAIGATITNDRSIEVGSGTLTLSGQSRAAAPRPSTAAPRSNWAAISPMARNVTSALPAAS